MGTVLAIAWQSPNIVCGARLALCAVPFDMQLEQDGLIQALLNLLEHTDRFALRFGESQLKVCGQHFYFRPCDFDYLQLGISF